MLFGQRGVGSAGSAAPNNRQGVEFANRQTLGERRAGNGGFGLHGRGMGNWGVDVWHGENGIEVKRVREGDPHTPGAMRLQVVPGGNIGGNVSVPTGFVGVAIYRGGSTYPHPLGPGYHMIPLAKETKLLSVQRQAAEISGRMISADGAHVDVTVSMLFRMLPEFGSVMHIAFPNGYKGAVETLLGDVAKSVIEGNNAEGIYREQQRVRDEIRWGVTDAMEGAGFFVEEVLVKRIALPQNFEESIRKRSEIAPLVAQTRELAEFQILTMQLQKAVEMEQISTSEEVGVQRADLELMILRMKKATELVEAQAEGAIAVERAAAAAQVRRTAWAAEAEVTEGQIGLQATAGKAEAEVAQEKGEAEVEVKKARGEAEAHTMGRKIGTFFRSILGFWRNE